MSDANGPCMAPTPYIATIPTGAIWCCSMSISTVTTAPASVRVIRPVGLALSRSCCNRVENHDDLLRPERVHGSRSSDETRVAGDKWAGRIFVVDDNRGEHPAVSRAADRGYEATGRSDGPAVKV